MFPRNLESADYQQGVADLPEAFQAAYNRGNRQLQFLHKTELALLLLHLLTFQTYTEADIFFREYRRYNVIVEQLTKTKYFYM